MSFSRSGSIMVESFVRMLLSQLLGIGSKSVHESVDLSKVSIPCFENDDDDLCMRFGANACVLNEIALNSATMM